MFTYIFTTDAHMDKAGKQALDCLSDTLNQSYDLLKVVVTTDQRNDLREVTITFTI
jgi:hypothetical protein